MRKQNVDPTSMDPSATYPTNNVDPTSMVPSANYENLLSMILDPLDVQAMIDTSLGSGLEGVLDPTDIQQMISDSLASGLEGVLDPIDVKAMIDASAVDPTSLVSNADYENLQSMILDP